MVVSCFMLHVSSFMLSISQLKELFEKNSIAPNKRLGQNFLVDEKVLSDIIATAKLTKNDSVIEVGGGVGTLTKDLAEKSGLGDRLPV